MVYKNNAWYVGVDKDGIERYGERLFKDDKVYIVVKEPQRSQKVLVAIKREYEVKPSTVRELEM